MFDHEVSGQPGVLQRGKRPAATSSTLVDAAPNKIGGCHTVEYGYYMNSLGRRNAIRAACGAIRQNEG